MCEYVGELLEYEHTTIHAFRFVEGGPIWLSIIYAR